jgi:hypothetical protein
MVQTENSPRHRLSLLLMRALRTGPRPAQKVVVSKMLIVTFCFLKFLPSEINLCHDIERAAGSRRQTQPDDRG